MSRDDKRIVITDKLGSNIFAGFLVRGGEASAAEKDPCSQAQLVSPTGLLSKRIAVFEVESARQSKRGNTQARDFMHSHL
jgi:hypothetical protein